MAREGNITNSELAKNSNVQQGEDFFTSKLDLNLRKKLVSATFGT
jgi:hypothetical protein